MGPEIDQYSYKSDLICCESNFISLTWSASCNRDINKQLIHGNQQFYNLELSLFFFVRTATSLQLQLPYSAVQPYDAEAFLNTYTKVCMTVRGTQANETSEVTLSLVTSFRLIRADGDW